MRVAEAGDVDAEQLQLGRQCRRRGRSPSPPSSRSATTSAIVVAGGDQAVAPGRRWQRALADRVDARVARCGRRRRRRRRRARRPSGRQSRASSSRGRMPAEKTTRSASSGRAVGERHAGDARRPRRRRSPGCRRRCGRRRPAPRCAAQRRAAALVDLHRHQPRRELDDVRVEPERRSALAASRPSSPPPTTAPVVRRSAAYASIACEVVDRAVDEAARRRRCRAPAARTGTSRWPAPGVVARRSGPERGGDRAGLAVDRARPGRRGAARCRAAR